MQNFIELKTETIESNVFLNIDVILSYHFKIPRQELESKYTRKQLNTMYAELSYMNKEENK